MKKIEIIQRVSLLIFSQNDMIILRIPILLQENQLQKEKISINEMDLEIYYNQLASKELQILELNEKIVELENEQPMVLIKGILFFQL